MARTKQRNRNDRRSKNKKGPKVAITRSADERGSGSKFFSLNDGEKFVGYALFDPDPASEDNDGYVEFKQHYDTQRSSYVPCWGAKSGCIFCKAGMNPSQRALGAFLVTNLNDEELDEPEVKIFRMNWTMIQEWADTFDEDGSTLGQKVRIKCIDHQDGDYTTKFYDKDRLTKKQIKEALEDVPDLEESIQRQLDRALENLRVQDVLEADDEEDSEEDSDEEDEDEDEEPKSKKRGRRKASDDDEDEEDEEDEDEDNNEPTDEEDEDEDSEDEESDEDEEDEESKIEGEYTVVSANDSEMTFTLKELDSDLYLAQELADDLDFDDFKMGDKLEVNAEKDKDGDWVATSLSKIAKKKDKSKKGGKKKSRR